jgi:hypothetical protein
MVAAAATTRRRVTRPAACTPDPEIPTLTVEDLGILRPSMLSRPKNRRDDHPFTAAARHAQRSPRTIGPRLPAKWRITVTRLPAVGTDWIPRKGTQARRRGIAPPSAAPPRLGQSR